MASTGQKVKTCLWFDADAEEAAAFYTSLFERSRITAVSRQPGGRALMVEFELDGVGFQALNGGPHYRLTEACSLSVACDSQAEIDRLWDALSAGGTIEQCGWLKDRYGLSWQIVPTALGELMTDPDRARARRVMEAMLQMKKLDISALRRAHAGR